jgi:hypothetical protein
MNSYEIHQYQRGDWQLDSTYENETLALREARRLETKGVEAIRVVEVSEKDTGRSRVVYRAGSIELLRAPSRAKVPADAKEQYISVGQIVGLVTIGMSALGVWIYLQLY